MEDLKRDMAILATSGRDWADRTRRPRGESARSRHLLTRIGQTDKRRMEDHVQRTGVARIDGSAANGLGKGRGAPSFGDECDLAGACSSAAAARRIVPSDGAKDVNVGARRANGQEQTPLEVTTEGRKIRQMGAAV
ncbi:hypothetical protein BE61_81360 [Bradyrhizobium elkanii USDA 61]|nr:hypothetical protein BE61_81360 [Bradyrhizobium elkanii USDA 61]